MKCAVGMLIFLLDCRAALAMTRVLVEPRKRIVAGTQPAGDTRARISVIARNEMTKQSSE